MSLSAIQSLIDDLVPDTGGRLKAGALDRAVEAARVHYSADRPLRLITDIEVLTAGNSVPLPAGWEPDFSVLQEVEYPVGNMPPSMLKPAAYAVIQSPSGSVIYVLDAVPAGATVRVTYSAPHVLTSLQCTIPPARFEAVACWAAALLADQLAAAYADNTEPTIAVDRVDQTSPSRTWAARAKAYRERYAQLVGVSGVAEGDRPTLKSACAEADLDITASDGGSWYRGRRRG